MSESTEKELNKLRKYQKWQERRQESSLISERRRLDQMGFESSMVSGVDNPIRISAIPYTKFEG